MTVRQDRPTRTEIEQALREHCLLDTAVMNPKNTGYDLNVSKNGLEVQLIVLFGVYELYIVATDLSDGHRVQPWSDCYGDSRHSDYLSELGQVLWALKNSDLRFTKNRKAIEFKKEDGTWHVLL